MGIETPECKIEWLDNDHGSVDPPADEADWRRIINETVGYDPAVRVVLVSNGRGAWWVSSATRAPVDSEPLPYPEDLRAQVLGALRGAGKSVSE